MITNQNKIWDEQQQKKVNYMKYSRDTRKWMLEFADELKQKWNGMFSRFGRVSEISNCKIWNIENKCWDEKPVGKYCVFISAVQRAMHTMYYT